MISQVMHEMGRKGGLKGGKARSEKPIQEAPERNCRESGNREVDQILFREAQGVLIVLDAALAYFMNL